MAGLASAFDPPLQGVQHGAAGGQAITAASRLGISGVVLPTDGGVNSAKVGPHLVSGGSGWVAAVGGM
jgi:hypothetical protein